MGPGKRKYGMADYIRSNSVEDGTQRSGGSMPNKMINVIQDVLVLILNITQHSYDFIDSVVNSTGEYLDTLTTTPPLEIHPPVTAFDTVVHISPIICPVCGGLPELTYQWDDFGMEVYLACHGKATQFRVTQKDMESWTHPAEMLKALVEKHLKEEEDALLRFQN